MAVSTSKRSDVIPFDTRRLHLHDDILEEWCEALFNGDAADARRYLRGRGLTQETIKRREIGLGEELWQPGNKAAYTIPVRIAGELRQVRLRTRDENARGDKYRPLWSTKDRERGTAPEWVTVGGLIYDPDNVLEWSEEVVLVEGELDAITALQYDFPAVTTTIGAKAWKSEWTSRFAGKRVPIIFDPDKDGRTGAWKRAIDLTGVAAEIRIVELPGGDVNDFFAKEGRSPDELRALIEAAPVFNPHDFSTYPGVEEEALDQGLRFYINDLARTFASSGSIAEIHGRDFDEMMATSTPKEIVEGTGIVEGGIIGVFGRSGAFKSATIQDLCWHLGSTGAWQHRAGIGRRLNSAYIALEGADGLGNRAQAWRIYSPEMPTPRFSRLDWFGDLAHPTYRKRLTDYLVGEDADIAVLDTYGKAITLFKGGTGNENSDANSFVEKLIEVARNVAVQTGRPLTWILIHHEGWEDGRPRGASAWAQACDIVLYFKPDPGVVNVCYVDAYKPSRDLAHLFRPWRVLAAPKRWGPEPEQASFVVQLDDAAPPVSKKQRSKAATDAENHEKVFDAVGDSYERTAAIEQRLTYHRTTVHRHLKRLAEEGRIAHKTKKEPGTGKDVDQWKKPKKVSGGSA